MKGEVAVRSQLLSAMAEQQNLMDALTAVSLLISIYLVHVCLPLLSFTCVSVYMHVHVHGSVISCSYYYMCVLLIL